MKINFECERAADVQRVITFVLPDNPTQADIDRIFEYGAHALGRLLSAPVAADTGAP